jgi:Fic family protein
LYLSQFFKIHRQAYYEYLYNIHSKGAYEAWIKFFLSGIIETSKEAANLARDIGVLRENDLRKINGLGRISGHALLIYEGLFGKPTVSIEEAILKLNITNASAGRLIDKMKEIGILASLDNRKRKRIFVYRNYMEVFNKD